MSHLHNILKLFKMFLLMVGMNHSVVGLHTYCKGCSVSYSAPLQLMTKKPTRGVMCDQFYENYLTVGSYSATRRVHSVIGLQVPISQLINCNRKSQLTQYTLNSYLQWYSIVTSSNPVFDSQNRESDNISQTSISLLRP